MLNAENTNNSRALMRIALATGNYHHVPDGVALTLNRLVAYLLDNGHEVLVFAPEVPDPPIKHVGRMVAVPSFPMPGRNEYRITWGLGPAGYDAIREFKPDLIHLATPDMAAVQLIFWAKTRNIPVVASYHTHFTSYMGYYRLEWTVPLIWALFRWFYGSTRAVYVPSQSMADVLEGYGIDKNIQIWARGVETDLYSPEKRNLAWRRVLGVADTDVLITFVSRLVWEKDLESVIQTFTRLHSDCPRVKTMIIGDGPAMHDLRSALPQTVFAGYLSGEDLAQGYASSDVFLFPSTTETFGNVTLEALACGLPAVVANASGNRSLVTNNRNGFLIPPYDVTEYVRLIKLLVNDDAKRADMSRQARTFAMGFTWETINGGLLSSYEDVVRS